MYDLIETCFCGEEMPLHVMNTPAGHYLGYFCKNFENGCGGPFDRVTTYMSEDGANKLLTSIKEEK